MGIQPRYSGLRVQGTATSPPSTVAPQYISRSGRRRRIATRVGGLPARRGSRRGASYQRLGLSDEGLELLDEAVEGDGRGGRVARGLSQRSPSARRPSRSRRPGMGRPWRRPGRAGCAVLWSRCRRVRAASRGWPCAPSRPARAPAAPRPGRRGDHPPPPPGPASRCPRMAASWDRALQLAGEGVRLRSADTPAGGWWWARAAVVVLGATALVVVVTPSLHATMPIKKAHQHDDEAHGRERGVVLGTASA